MLRSPLLPIFLTVFVDVMGLTLMLPLLPFYAEHFGASPLQVGALAASFAVCQLISGPVLGRISDRVGRKPTLLASQAGTFVGFLVLGAANSLPLLFLGRIIDGLTAGNLSIAQAYIADVTKPENRTRAFGLIGVAFAAGFLLGPAISGALARGFGYSAPAYGAAGLSLLSILFTATLLPNVRPAASKGGSRWGDLLGYFRRPAPRARLLEFFAFILSFATLTGGLALFLERRMGFDVEQVGYTYAFSGLVGGFVQGGAIGRLVKRLGEERLSLYGLLAMSAAYLLLIPVTTLPHLGVAIVLGALGSAVTRPSLTTLLSASVSADEQGAALGVQQSLSSVAQIVGPLAAGWVIEHQHLWAYGALAAAFALSGVLLRLGRAPR